MAGRPVARFPMRAGFGGFIPQGADTAYANIYNAAREAIGFGSEHPEIYGTPNTDAWNEWINLVNQVNAIDTGEQILSQHRPGGWAATVAEEIRQRTANVLAYRGGASTTPDNGGAGPANINPHSDEGEVPLTGGGVPTTVQTTSGGSTPVTGGSGTPVTGVPVGTGSSQPVGDTVGGNFLDSIENYFADMFGGLAAQTGLSLQTIEIIAAVGVLGGLWYLSQGSGKRR